MYAHESFERRHIGINDTELQHMLATLQVNSLPQLINETIPDDIRLAHELAIPPAQSEHEYLQHLQTIAAKNTVARSFIGMGYYGTITPSVIARSLFQNPGWYTQYTPYQAEIAQGRLESLLNFQTMVSDLTGLPIANASLLDEGTAAAEAMALFYQEKNKRAKGDYQNEFFVADTVFPQTLAVVQTRAAALDIKVIVGDWKTFQATDKTFAVLLQYPNKEGAVEDYRAFTAQLNAQGIYCVVAADILSLTLLTPPGEWGADAVVGNTQRLGVPMGFGGPHAAYFATKDDFKRQLPGRIIGLSIDAHGNPALRMALQTREQHIRREKATSNICTAQALLANMAAMYAVYHGAAGLKAIAQKIHSQTQYLEEQLEAMDFEVRHSHYFDTLCIDIDDPELLQTIRTTAEERGYNFYYGENYLQISLDETVQTQDLEALCTIFATALDLEPMVVIPNVLPAVAEYPAALRRESAYLTHPVFNSHHTETKMMRYLKRLENKDLSLTHAMISLGSCTMKLNAATQMIPVSWAAFADIHPFAPASQTQGYQQIFKELAAYLCACTGFDACSLQPNSGAQGEYAGLLTIKAYHEDRGDFHRKVAIIPSSAHGTNPASAVMAGMDVVVVNCDEKGNIDVDDLKAKVEQHKDRLSCLMVTYPSTHGVFETAIKEICALIHTYGGKVYMDGANMNAQVGLTNPAAIGADVCHLNLHKTFAIPHGGGGPGMGPICVNSSLAPYLPTHPLVHTGGEKGISAVSAAPWGSASILLISYGYIRLLGAKGLKHATKYAILNSNYIKARLEGVYSILYTGEKGRCAHELIVDLRPFKAIVSAEDVAKRLIDYGFHAPTLSFPVAGTIMIEPTESESLEELDRFCDALLAIRQEIDEIAKGEYPADNNVLVNAPHTQRIITADEWTYPYTREKAAFPLAYLQQGYKFWASIGRVNNAQGDRQLICTCPPVSDYMTAS